MKQSRCKNHKIYLPRQKYQEVSPDKLEDNTCPNMTERPEYKKAKANEPYIRCKDYVEINNRKARVVEINIS